MSFPEKSGLGEQHPTPLPHYQRPGLTRQAAEVRSCLGAAGEPQAVQRAPGWRWQPVVILQIPG